MRLCVKAADGDIMSSMLGEPARFVGEPGVGTGSKRIGPPGSVFISDFSGE